MNKKEFLFQLCVEIKNDLKLYRKLRDDLGDPDYNTPERKLQSTYKEKINKLDAVYDFLTDMYFDISNEEENNE